MGVKKSRTARDALTLFTSVERMCGKRVGTVLSTVSGDRLRRGRVSLYDELCNYLSWV